MKLKDLIASMQCWLRDHPDIEVRFAGHDGEEYLASNEYLDDNNNPTKLWVELEADEKSPTRGMLMGFGGVFLPASDKTRGAE